MTMLVLESWYVCEGNFVHLEFHIYDGGFQSPNLGTAKPMVYATALLILAVVNLLNLAAMVICARFGEKYKSATF